MEKSAKDSLVLSHTGRRAHTKGGGISMAYQAVRLTKAGHLATITLNRPERLNAVNGQLRQDLHAALDEVAADDGVRAVILTGEGRGFCAGADVTGMRALAEGSPQTAPASPAQGAAAGPATPPPLHI